MQSELIGHLELLKCSYSHDQIKEMLKFENCEKIELEYSPYCICALPNDSLLCSFPNYGVGLFDKELKLVKISNFLSNPVKEKVNIWSCASNNLDRIYLADVENHEIIMTDFQLNEIKTVGSIGDGGLQFYDPRLAYSNGYIYVAEHVNKRIQVMNDEFTFISIHQIDYCPRYIQVANKTALVASFSPRCIYAYDIDSFIVKYKYDGHNGSISVINSVFYEYDYHNYTFYCYNDDGVFIDKIQVNNFKNQSIQSYDGSLQVFNDALICSSHSAKKLFKVKSK